VTLDAVLDEVELDEPVFAEPEPVPEPGPMFVHLCVVPDLGLALELLLELSAGPASATTGADGLADTEFDAVDLVLVVAFVALCVTLCVARAGCAPATTAPTPAVPPTTARPATRRPTGLSRMITLFLAGAPSTGRQQVYRRRLCSS
jgi:hypothetical protein